MLGYKYNTEQEAKDARKLAADFKGLPLSPNEIFITFNTLKVWKMY